jgi:hypothetical protein
VSSTPDEPVTEVQPPARDADVTPTSAAPEPPPAFEPAPPVDLAPPAPAGGGFTEQHPEALVGGAFVGGAVLALVLKRFGRS